MLAALQSVMPSASQLPLLPRARLVYPLEIHQKVAFQVAELGEGR